MQILIGQLMQIVTKFRLGYPYQGCRHKNNIYLVYYTITNFSLCQGSYLFRFYGHDTPFQIRSIMFQVEDGFDFLVINGDNQWHYTGRDRINIVTSAHFVIHFESDENISSTGFVLRWICI